MPRTALLSRLTCLLRGPLIGLPASSLSNLNPFSALYSVCLKEIPSHSPVGRRAGCLPLQANDQFPPRRHTDRFHLIPARFSGFISCHKGTLGPCSAVTQMSWLPQGRLPVFKCRNRHVHGSLPKPQVPALGLENAGSSIRTQLTGRSFHVPSPESQDRVRCLGLEYDLLVFPSRLWAPQGRTCRIPLPFPYL